MKEIFGIKKVERQGETKSFWTRIGIAHENKDGSLNCYMDYVPVIPNITLNIRDPKEKENKGEETQNENDGNGNF
jgi:hypothetical protein